MVADDKIEVYGCYGNSRHIIINGRLFDSKEKQIHSLEDGFFTNLKNKLAQIFNDEKENEPITITIGRYRYQIESDDEGYYNFEATTELDYFQQNQKIDISINKDKTVTSCNAFIPTKTSQIGVISDFDDTLIISEVTDKINLIKNLLFKNYKQRVLTKEVKEKIQEIITDDKKALFILTGSPKQLQKSIHNFLDHHDFPKRTVITKQLNGDNSDPILDQIEYKYAKIQKLILLYPQIKWVLIGDSGEKDKEVYSKIRKAYPHQIEAIYIRNVENGKIRKI
jgi:phosphatidate phosphatase APP1